MRLAVVSDVHGNLPALEAVLEDIHAAQADLTVNLGDIVSGPLWPAETAARLMAMNLPTIRGNHERQVLAPDRARMGASDAFAATRLDAPTRSWLAALPATLALDGGVFCCHGTPADDLVYLLETVVPGHAGSAQPGIRAATVAEVAGRLADAPGRVILCGHSHVPRAVQLPDGRLAVNPGSVGLQAYDDVHPHPHIVENGTPHARYALLTKRASGWQVDLRAVPYDHESTACRAEEAGRGDWADALRTGRVGRWETPT